MLDMSMMGGPGSFPPLKPLTTSGPLNLLQPSSGTILGATVGSTITSNIAGLTVNSDARTYTWSGVGTAGLVANALVETHPMSVTLSLASGLTLL